MAKKGKESGQSRLNRINDEIKKEVSQIINYEVKDPRLEEFITVVRVETTNDLYHCKIYISVFGDEEKVKKVLEGLRSAKGFIKREIARRINLRQTPELQFLHDNSLEHAIKINALISKISKELKENESLDEVDENLE
ncbi:MAG: 30S ribosome-binding factor RbfA [Lachnospirales bacterium]